MPHLHRKVDDAYLLAATDLRSLDRIDQSVAWLKSERQRRSVLKAPHFHGYGNLAMPAPQSNDTQSASQPFTNISAYSRTLLRALFLRFFRFLLVKIKCGTAAHYYYLPDIVKSLC